MSSITAVYRLEKIGAKCIFSTILECFYKYIYKGPLYVHVNIMVYIKVTGNLINK